jgi:hypothetical protein
MDIEADLRGASGVGMVGAGRCEFLGNSSR